MKVKKRLRSTSLVNYLLVLLLFYSCKTVAPTGPAESYLYTPENFPKQLSSIHLPIEVSLESFEKEINKEVKGLIFEDNTLDDNERSEKYHVKVWKNDEISMEAFGEDIILKVPLKVWAKGAFNFDQLGIDLGEASKEIDFQANVLFRTKVNVSEDWEIVTHTEPAGIEWVKKPSLKLGFLKLPIAGFVEPLILNQQKALAGEFDSRISKDLNIKSYVKEAWANLQKPFLLNKEYDAWLHISPQDFSFKPFSGSGKTFSAVMTLEGLSETSLGQRPQKVVSQRLPKISLNDSATFSDRFEIVVNSEINHQYAEKLAKDVILNQTFTYKNGKKKVKVTDLKLYGNGNDIVVKAMIEGDMSGTVFLKGVPYYNEKDRSVSLKGLDFDIDTRNKLHRTANWLLHGRFVNEFEKVIKVPIGKQLDEAKAVISQNIENKKLGSRVVLDGKLEDIKPVDFYVTSESYVAVIKATGKAVVKGAER